MSRRKDVSLKDIAEKLGLTVHTVSKALRGRRGMSEQTRRLVFRTAREMGYRTRAQELSLAADRVVQFYAKQHRFVFVSERNGEIVDLLYEGIRDRLSELGHRADLLVCPVSTETPSVLREWIDSTDLSFASGIFIAPMVTPSLEKALLELPIPKILVNYPFTGLEADSVIWDVYDAMGRCVNVLAAAGHSRILYVGPVGMHRGFRLRWQAFREALEDNGIRTDPDDCLLTPEPELEVWLRSFADKWERLKPTAVICAVEYLLPWIFSACETLGIAVPDEASVVSLETLEPSAAPNVTCPSLPVRDTGVRAADRMLWRMANPHLPYEHLRLQCRWHHGSTVKSMRMVAPDAKMKRKWN